eukprot:3520278-Ditylum_brightwellii.AAC.1
MKAAPAPVVLTAGVGRNFKPAANKNRKGKGGKQVHIRNNQNIAADDDEEAGTSILSASATTALHANGEGNNNDNNIPA